MIGKFFKNILGGKPKDGSAAAQKEGLIDTISKKSDQLVKTVIEKSGAVQEELVIIKSKLSNLQETNYNLGLKMIETGRISEAIFRFRLIKKFWPEPFDAYYQLSYSLVLANKPSQAKIVLEELLRKKPDFDTKAQDLLNHINSISQPNN